MSDLDQRKSIRLPVPPDSGEAVLRLGRTSVIVKLVDASAGGFGVRLESESPIVLGQPLVLGTCTGWCRVRVAHIRLDDDGRYVGLQHLSDLPVDWHKRSWFHWWHWDHFRAGFPHLGWSSLVGGAGVVLVVALAALAWRAAPRDGSFTFHLRPRLSIPSGTAGGSSPPLESGNPPQASESWTYGGSTRSRPNHRPAPPPTNAAERWTYERSQDAGDWLHEFGELPELISQKSRRPAADGDTSGHIDAAALLKPDMARQLDLTPQQRSQIADIVRTCNRAVEEAYRNADNYASPALRQKIATLRRQANDDALDVLTSGQRQRLRSAQR